MHARIAQRARSLGQAAALVSRVSATEESLLPSTFASRLVVQEALGFAERHLWSDASLRAPKPHLGSCGPVSSRSYCTSGYVQPLQAFAILRSFLYRHCNKHRSQTSAPPRGVLCRR